MTKIGPLLADLLAAVVRGQAAVGMLHTARVPARLVSADGSVLRLGGWPADAETGRAA